MPVIELKITVPEGTTLTISGLEELVASTASPEATIERYWRDYLSPNARKLFMAAARLEDFRGPGYTLEDIAHNLSINYESARSFQQTSGRIARKWRDDNGAEPPIRLLWEEERQAEAPNRTTYHLPPGVADVILGFSAM